MPNRQNVGNVRTVVLTSFVTVSMLAFVVAPALTVLAQEVPTPTPAVVLGCLDSSAGNFNPDATQDDGTCIYPSVSPTVDPAAATDVATPTPTTLPTTEGVGTPTDNVGADVSVSPTPDTTPSFTITPEPTSTPSPEATPF